MTFREARTSDIQQLQLVRQTVKEKVLFAAKAVTEYDYLRYLTVHGKGWVCEVGNKIIGFCIVDLAHKNIWALCVKPGYEVNRVCKTLNDLVLNWYFTRDLAPLTLTVAAGSDAEEEYTEWGWTVKNKALNGETSFEMQYNNWRAVVSARNN
jgi:hypothetical protein